MHPFPSLEPVYSFMSGTNCCFLRFLRRQAGWSVISISLRIFQFAVIYTVKGFRIVNEAEVDVFLEFPCFLHDPTECWQSDLWFLCPYEIQLVHLEVLSSYTAEA